MPCTPHFEFASLRIISVISRVHLHCLLDVRTCYIIILRPVAQSSVKVDTQIGYTGVVVFESLVAFHVHHNQFSIGYSVP